MELSSEQQDFGKVTVHFASYGYRGPAGRARGGMWSDTITTLATVHMQRSHRSFSYRLVIMNYEVLLILLN